jgi:DNA modification methylase
VSQPAAEAAPLPVYDHERVTVHLGDCLDVLAGLPDSSVHAVVCDPPYGLSDTTSAQVADTLVKWVTGDRGYVPGGRGFMGKTWDGFVPPPAVWDECLRVLVPGGHLLTFAGTRTADLMSIGLRLAGFDIRETLVWAYGQGFPKNLDVGKAIDKLVGVEGSWRREDHPGRVGARTRPGDTFGQSDHRNGENPEGLRHVYEAASDQGQQWTGWGTALKPSYEPIVMARKPFAGTIAENVLAHGTSALNIDGCRIPFASDADRAESEGKNAHARFGTEPGGNNVYGDFTQTERVDYDGSKGRWPTNLILAHAPGCEQIGTITEVVGGGSAGSSGFVDGYERGDGFVGSSVTSPVWQCVAGCPVGAMDGQSGTSRSRPGPPRAAGSGTGEGWRMTATGAEYADEGGASRFFSQVELDVPGLFYVAKANTKERPSTEDAAGRVTHPTVKPVALMRHLVRLVTPPGGVVLDPFAGSGTTGEAALLEGMRSVLIEREPDYVPLIAQRLDRHLRPEEWLRSTGQAEGTLFG